MQVMQHRVSWKFRILTTTIRTYHCKKIITGFLKTELYVIYIDVAVYQTNEAANSQTNAQHATDVVSSPVTWHLTEQRRHVDSQERTTAELARRRH